LVGCDVFSDAQMTRGFSRNARLHQFHGSQG
jgi:hypothetical protein